MNTPDCFTVAQCSGTAHWFEYGFRCALRQLYFPIPDSLFYCSTVQSVLLQRLDPLVDRRVCREQSG
jgi:hypothetical protein